MNHDLALAIWDSWPVGHVAVYKIKARRDSTKVVSTLDWWGITANHLADRLANTALSTETSAVVALADTIASHKRQERDQLLQALNFLVELALVRKEAIEAHENFDSSKAQVALVLFEVGSFQARVAAGWLLILRRAGGAAGWCARCGASVRHNRTLLRISWRGRASMPGRWRGREASMPGRWRGRVASMPGIVDSCRTHGGLM